MKKILILLVMASGLSSLKASRLSEEAFQAIFEICYLPKIVKNKLNELALRFHQVFDNNPELSRIYQLALEKRSSSLDERYDTLAVVLRSNVFINFLLKLWDEQDTNIERNSIGFIIRCLKLSKGKKIGDSDTDQVEQKDVEDLLDIEAVSDSE